MKKNITAVSAVPERTIGIDLSDGTFRYCALNREGKIVDEGQRKLDPDSVRKFLARGAPGRAGDAAAGPVAAAERARSDREGAGRHSENVWRLRLRVRRTGFHRLTSSHR